MACFYGVFVCDLVSAFSSLLVMYGAVLYCCFAFLWSTCSCDDIVSFEFALILVWDSCSWFGEHVQFLV